MASETQMHHFDALRQARRVARRLVGFAQSHFSKCICVSPAIRPKSATRLPSGESGATQRLNARPRSCSNF
jgi:hypothetical protein